MNIAVFPGSFDPFTVGHADIVRRGLQLFDRVIVAVGYNSQKLSGSPVEDRVAAIARIYMNEPRVEVVSYSDLTVDLAQRLGARFLLRGVRSVKDFEKAPLTSSPIPKASRNASSNRLAKTLSSGIFCIGHFAHSSCSFCSRDLHSCNRSTVPIKSK